MSFFNKKGKKKKNIKKAKAKYDVELKKHLKIAQNIIKTLGVNAIIPSEAINVAENAIQEDDSVTIKIPDKGYLVICLDGYELHSIVKLDDKDADNYDPEAVGTFKSLVTDNRRIASVTLANDKADGFIVMLPTRKTLLSLQSIAAMADVENKKLFTWALLPINLTENTPVENQEVIEVKADKVSLSDLLDASDNKIKPVATIDDDTISVTLPTNDGFDDKPDEQPSITPLKDQQVTTDEQSDKQSNDEKETNEQSATDAPEITTEDADDLFGDIELDDVSLDDDKSTTTTDDPFAEQSNDDTQSNTTVVKDEKPTEKETVSKETIKKEPEKTIYDDQGIATNGIYKGLTADEINNYQLENGFNEQPTQAEIDQIIANRQKVVQPATTKDVKDDHAEDKKVVIKRLANYKGLDTPDLTLHVDEHAIENITDASEPYQFKFEEPSDENDTLTQSLNARKQNMNDEMREQFNKDKKNLNDAFSNDLHTLISTAQKRYSLSNMDGYGKIKQSIEDRYQKKRNAAENQITKKQKQLNDTFERDVQAVGNAAKKKAIAEYHKENDDLLMKQKQQIRENELRQINYDQARDMNAMYAERQEESDIFINKRFADLLKIYTERWNAMQANEKQIFDDNHQALDAFVHDKFDEFARQKENIADIKRHDNQVNELKQAMSNLKQDTAKQIRDAENDAQVKISQIKNDTELQIQRKNDELKAKDRERDAALDKQRDDFNNERESLKVQIHSLNTQLQKADDRKDAAIKEQEKSDQEIIRHWRDTVKSLESSNKGINATNDELRKQLDDIDRKTKHRVVGASIGSAIAGALVSGVIALFGMTMVTTHNTDNRTQQQSQQPVYVMQQAPQQQSEKNSSHNSEQQSSQSSQSSVASSSTQQ